MFADKMINRDGDVGTPLPQATASQWERHGDGRRDLAKLFVGNVLLQIAVGGGDLQKSIDGMQQD